MLVLFGANGRTGVEVLREARRRGLAVRPVVRDDRDSEHIDGVVDVRDIHYADPEHPESLGPTLEGATQVVSCIDPRTAGPGAPMYSGAAATNIVMAADAAGAEISLWVSVMGAYRWSYAKLNRKSFGLESGVRVCPAPWAILRISCYFDEVLEGHVRPPDGGKPYTFKDASRYAPVSRADGASMILDFLDRCESGRAQCAGGPAVYTGPELERLVGPHRRGSGKRTAFAPLPPGDVSVDPETTLRTVGRMPARTLESELEASDKEADPQLTERTVYPVGDPKPHGADTGDDWAALAGFGQDLRRVMHHQLVLDLARLGIDTKGVSLDFGEAQRGERGADAHGGVFVALAGVTARRGDEVVHRGDVDFLRDKVAEEFYCWWEGDGIPERVWHQLDMGVRRRLPKDVKHRDDERVKAFAASFG